MSSTPWSVLDISDAMADVLHVVSAHELASLCDSLAMPSTTAAPMASKRVYVRSRVRGLPRDELEKVAAKVVTEFARVWELASYRGAPVDPQWIEVYESLRRYIESRSTPPQRFNLVFATEKKPDIVIVDVPGNRIAARDDSALIYDETIDREGLTLGQLKAWWIAKKGDSEKLYPRLRDSLGSRAEKVFFDHYYRFALQQQDGGNSLPALLPQVWLQYDPVTRAERGGLKALPRQRLDFLMLAAEGRKIVLEVDGPQHIQGDGGRTAYEVYQEQLAADRALVLDGYEVYRFGADEVAGASGVKVMDEFLRRARLTASLSDRLSLRAR